METLNHHRLLTFTPMWSSFWKKNLNLYRFLGFPFSSVHNTHFYLQEMSLLYGKDPTRYTCIEDRLIIGKRLRISFFKFVLFLLLIVGTNFFVSRDITHIYFYVIVSLSICVAFLFSFFYSWEQDFKRTFKTIEENRLSNKLNFALEDQMRMVEKVQIAYNQELLDDLSALKKKVETKKVAKEAVLLKAGNREFHFQAKELLLIEYFKFITKDYRNGETKINFQSFKQPEIVKSLQTKYGIDNKKSAIEVKLRNRSFLNLNIDRTSRKKDSNNATVCEIQEYLLLGEYKNAACKVQSYIEKERNRVS